MPTHQPMWYLRMYFCLEKASTKILQGSLEQVEPIISQIKIKEHTMLKRSSTRLQTSEKPF